MSDGPAPARTALGAACATFDGAGRVLLVHHAYSRINWEQPGGFVEPGEAPAEADHALGRMLHFVAQVRFDEANAPTPSSPEISEVGFLALRQWRE
ncbi:MAG TPA: NUDIX hydrolase [Candidatus Limnocylindria bacterium]|nr:NUDIX hydrolase [Candidatus Limnocylindria bacterium]